MYAFSSAVRACPLGIECHFSRQPRQQVAVPVLGDEDRVVPHRSLLAVIRRIGRGETLLDELLPVRHHRLQTLAYPGIPFPRREGGIGDGRKNEPASRRAASKSAVHLGSSVHTIFRKNGRRPRADWRNESRRLTIPDSPYSRWSLICASQTVCWPQSGSSTTCDTTSKPFWRRSERYSFPSRLPW